MRLEGKKDVKFEESVALSCFAESVPPSTYTWKLNSTGMNISLPTYTIEKAKGTDSGTYTCKATNPITGMEKETTFKLAVTGKHASAFFIQESIPIFTSQIGHYAN